MRFGLENQACRCNDLTVYLSRHSFSEGGMNHVFLFSVVRLIERWDVDLVHLQHRVHNALRLRRVFVRQHLDQYGGNDLPRQTEFVPEPTASAFFAAKGEFRPKIIDLFLCLAVYDKRDRFREFEDRTAIERHEFLSFELEFNGHDRSRRPAGWPCCLLVIPSDLSNLRVLENRGVKLLCLFRFVFEPYEWSFLLRYFSCHCFIL